jgi:hypothetical protein
VPAAAVIPAPIAYIKVVAVKKLVVGFLVGTVGWSVRKDAYWSCRPPSSQRGRLALVCWAVDLCRLL